MPIKNPWSGLLDPDERDTSYVDHEVGTPTAPPGSVPYTVEAGAVHGMPDTASPSMPDPTIQDAAAYSSQATAGVDPLAGTLAGLQTPPEYWPGAAPLGVHRGGPATLTPLGLAPLVPSAPEPLGVARPPRRPGEFGPLTQRAREIRQEVESRRAAINGYAEPSAAPHFAPTAYPAADDAARAGVTAHHYPQAPNVQTTVLKSTSPTESLGGYLGIGGTRYPDPDVNYFGRTSTSRISNGMSSSGRNLRVNHQTGVSVSGAASSFSDQGGRSVRTSKTVEQNALREAEPQLFGANPVQVAANGNAGTPPASVQAGRSIPLPRPAPRPKEVHYPVGGEERNDRVGSGWYNAPRGRRTHDGVDITANPGEPVVAPIDGEVVRRGFVYSANTAGNNPHLRNMQSVHIEGSGKYKGMKTVLYYVDGTGPAVHEKVKAGTTILGLVQDVPGAYAKDPDPNRVKRNAGMKPHVHLEVIWQGKKIDPAGVLPLWKSAGGIGSP